MMMMEQLKFHNISSDLVSHFQSCFLVSEIAIKIINKQKIGQVHIYITIFSVPADGLAANGAKPSAGTVMTKFRLLLYMGPALNTLGQRQNGRYFPDNIFKWIFLNENVWISIKISRKFVPEGPINNIPALVQIRAWWRSGDKPLSESMMAYFIDAYMCHSA